MTPRCYRKHAEDDPAIGQPIEPKKPARRAAEKAAEAAQKKLSPGLEPKTVVNAHRMLHRAWEDFTVWGWASGTSSVTHTRPGSRVRAVRSGPSPSSRSSSACTSDRFFALWVLEATSGMRRCELAGARRDLLDLDAGTLTIEATRVVVDGKVIESDGKTENAQHRLALDPFTLAALPAHVELLDRERTEFGPGLPGSWVLFCWENGPPAPGHHHPPVQAAGRGGRAAEIDLHDVRHSYATAAGREDRLEGAQQAHRPRRRRLHHEAVRPDRPGSRPPGREHPRRADHRRAARVLRDLAADGRQGIRRGRRRSGLTRSGPFTNPCTNGSKRPLP